MQYLARWPLLLTGLVVMAWGVLELRDPGESQYRLAVLALGACIIGAGVVLVALGYRDDGPPEQGR